MRKNKDYIGFSETAQLLRRSRATVYRLMSDGKLTACYRRLSPRTPFFLRAEVEALCLDGPEEPDVDKSLAKKVKTRDGQKCVICYATYQLIAHHVVPLEQGGPDSLANQVTLCPWCHRNLHHTGATLARRAKAHGTEAVTDWLLRSSGLPGLEQLPGTL